MSEGFFGSGRRPPRRQLRRPSRGALLTLGVVLVSGLAGLEAVPWAAGLQRLLADEPPLRVRAVRVLGAREVPAAELAAASGVAPGAPLASVDVRTVETRLLGHPWVQRVRALRVPPSHLVLKIGEREPVLVAADPADGAFYVADREGVPFARASERHAHALPRAERARGLRPGVAHPMLTRAAAVVQALRARGFTPTRVEPEDDATLAFRLAGRERTLVVGADALGPQLDRMETLLEAGGTPVAATHADLRFAGQVVLRGTKLAPVGAEGGR